MRGKDLKAVFKTANTAIFIFICVTALLITASCGRTTSLENSTVQNNDLTEAGQAESEGDPRFADAIVDPPVWISNLNGVYVAAEIRSISDKTVTSYATNADDLVEMECIIRYSRNTVPSKTHSAIAKDSIRNIHVTEKAAKELNTGDIIFFRVEDRTVTYKPKTDKDGKSEFIRFVDGVIDMEGKKLSDYDSFGELLILNGNIQAIASYRQPKEGAAFGDNRGFGNGMTIWDIEDYFQAWDKAEAAWYEWREAQTNGFY